MNIQHTDPEQVHEIKIKETMSSRYSPSYGKKLSTCYMIKYGKPARWRRVYCVNYSNSGSIYIIVDGKDLYIDTETYYDLERARDRYLIQKGTK